MKLYFWTEHDWDLCNHYVVFADSLEEAKELVAEKILEYWRRPPPENGSYGPNFTWSEKQLAEFEESAQREIREFLTNEKFQFEVFEIEKGCHK